MALAPLAHLLARCAQASCPKLCMKECGLCYFRHLKVVCTIVGLCLEIEAAQRRVPLESRLNGLRNLCRSIFQLLRGAIRDPRHPKRFKMGWMKARASPPKAPEEPGKAAETVKTGTCKFRVPVS